MSLVLLARLRSDPQARVLREAFETAIAEYEQELGIRPGTLCAYDVEADRFVDLTDAAGIGAAGVEPSDLSCPWKQIALVEKKRPPTWDLAGRPVTRGIVGVRVPSGPRAPRRQLSVVALERGRAWIAARHGG